VVDQIERLTGLPYENLLDPNDPLASNDPDDPNDFHSVSRGPYTISWKVVENSPVNGAKRIAVTADGSHRRARPGSP
jgi:hypothetical protein